MKIYSYNTQKLYESAGSFVVLTQEITKKGGKPESSKIGRYNSMEEALDVAQDCMVDIAKEEGRDDNRIECKYTDHSVIYTDLDDGTVFAFYAEESVPLNSTSNNTNTTENLLRFINNVFASSNKYSSFDEMLNYIAEQVCTDESIMIEDCQAFADYIKNVCSHDDEDAYEVEQELYDWVKNEQHDVTECQQEAPVEESVALRFSKYRSLFESDDMSECGMSEEDAVSEEDDDADKDKSDDEENEDKDKEDDDEDKDKEDDGDDDDDDDDEAEEMGAVLLTIDKEDKDACKDELVAAGIAEDDIEVLDADEDDDKVKIRVEPSSVFELKDYLAGKGIDLEEKIGGKIVSDDEDDEGDDEDSENDDKDKEGEEDTNFDIDELGDIFGADE